MSSIRESGSTTVKSAERLLDVLEVLTRHTRPVPTMTLARQCGIPKSSMHHLLNVMRARNYVTYFESERAWGLGFAAFEIGAAYLRSEPLQRLGRPMLLALTETTGDTSHLAVLHGTDVLYIDKQEPEGAGPKLVTEVGVRLPAHLTAVGRAILAELPEPQVRALYAHQPLVLRTGQGPSSIDRLLEDLAVVRGEGFCCEHELVTPGIACAAAVVRSHECMPVAAVGVTWVAAQRSDADVDSLARVLRETAAELSRRLGYRNPNQVAETV